MQFRLYTSESRVRAHTGCLLHTRVPSTKIDARLIESRATKNVASDASEMTMFLDGQTLDLPVQASLHEGANFSCFCTFPKTSKRGNGCTNQKGGGIWCAGGLPLPRKL